MILSIVLFFLITWFLLCTNVTNKKKKLKKKKKEKRKKIKKKKNKQLNFINFHLFIFKSLSLDLLKKMSQEPWDELPAVVMDNGSGNVKCGFAGKDVPSVIFPAITSHPRSNPQGPVLVGDRALAATGQVYKHPLEHGIVTDWDGLERLWRHAYEELQVPSTERAIVVTEAPLNPTKNRERMAELLFEQFQVPALNFQIQAVMTMYSNGRVDGLVVDSGDGITHTVPIFEGRTVGGAIRRSDIAGRDLTEWMMELLNDEVTSKTFTTSADRELARQLKEQSCRASLDFEGELEAIDNGKVEDEPVTLPDGTQISFPRAKICCPELLFNPQIAERHASSL
ncbi:MAG: actin family protein, partial [Deltaproteobacteria bacterium]|nr:actin family protein [Deltaproteobacteria bacterium]